MRQRGGIWHSGPHSHIHGILNNRLYKHRDPLLTYALSERSGEKDKLGVASKNPFNLFLPCVCV